MLKYLAQRLLLIAIVSVAIIFFVQLGMNMVSNSSTLQPNYNWGAQIQSAWQETVTYVEHAFDGDMGVVVSGQGAIPVQDILKETFVNSMGLLLPALALSILIGLSAGTVAVLSKKIPLAVPLLFVTIIGISVPSFFAAMLLQIAEIQWVRTFGSPLVSVGGFAWDWKHMLLPVLVLAARPVAYLTRSTFLSFNGVMGEDFIRTAWSKGLGMPAVVSWHALKNVAIPVLAAIGVSLRFALASLPVVEFFFGWPGLGNQMLVSIRAGQTDVVVALALALGLTFILVNLALDVSYRFIDPRLKYE